MDDAVSIFGGTNLLRARIQQAIDDHHETIFVITTCMSGIIGDNSKDLVDEFVLRFPDLKFFLIEADGNMIGDYRDGFVSCIEEIVKDIDTSVRPLQKNINLIGMSFFKYRKRAEFVPLEEILTRMNININCRFIDSCTMEDIQNFCRGELDILTSDYLDGRGMGKILTDGLGDRKSLTMPSSIEETKRFIRDLGDIVDEHETADILIQEIEDSYNSEMKTYKETLEGKKALVICNPESNIDWNIDMLKDLGMIVLKIGIVESRIRNGSPFDSKYKDITTTKYDIRQLESDIDILQPDIVIGDLVQIADTDSKWMFLMRKDIGIDASLDYIRRMANVVCLPKGEGWRS